MKNIPNSKAREALEKMKLEIAKEFDSSITHEEKMDGTMVRDLVNRADKKIADLEKSFTKK